MSSRQLYNELVLCGHNLFLNSMNDVKKWFAERNVNCYISYNDEKLWQNHDIFSFDKFINQSYQETIRRIRNPVTFGVVIFNQDLYNIPNYVEPSIFAAIAIAMTQGKKVYLTYGYPELYERELKSWNCTLINGDINQIYHDIKERIKIETLQLKLFPE